jgi:hypothetical protein
MSIADEPRNTFQAPSGAACWGSMCGPTVKAVFLSMPLLTELGRSKDGLRYRHGAPNGAFPKPESTEASIVNISFMWSLDTVPSWPPTF